MSSTLFSHQTETTTHPAGPRRARRAARPGTANSRSGGLPPTAGVEVELEAEAADAGDPDVTTDLPVDDGGLEDAGPGEEYPAERPATGYAAAFDAAVELAMRGEHVHLVGSGQSECVSLHCEPEPIGGLSL